MCLKKHVRGKSHLLAFLRFNVFCAHEEKKIEKKIDKNEMSVFILPMYLLTYLLIYCVPFDNIASQKIVEKSRNITPKVPNDTKKSQTISNVPVDSRKESRYITA